MRDMRNLSEIIFDDASILDRVRLVHRIVVEPDDLTFKLFLYR